MGPDLGGGDGSKVGEALGLAPVLGEEGGIEPPDMAVGLERAWGQAAFVRQMLQPGGQGLVGGQSRIGHRSAVRSSTRVRKDTSSQPIERVKPSGSGEPKAHRPGRPGSNGFMRIRATLFT